MLQSKTQQFSYFYLKLHKIRATSFGVLPSSGPSEN